MNAVASTTSNYALSAPSLPARDVVFWGLVLCFIQILDGILTLSGINQHGIAMEANDLIRSLMTSIGVVPALTLVKSIALALIGVCVLLSSHVSWIVNALRGLCGFYVVVAILPWILILNGIQV